MKIIILSKGRPDTIRTHLLFKDHDYTLVLHNEMEREKYLKNPTIDPNKILVSNAPIGVAFQREWIQRHMLTHGEWYLSLDDNIRSFKAVPEPEYSQHTLPVQETPAEMKPLFEKECSTDRFLAICEDMRRHGEQVGAYNLGFGTTPNFFFRGKKYRYVGYVISKAVVRKNVGIPFEVQAQSMEDYAYTAENILRHGKVLINNYVFPVAGHYEPGGIGTYPERVDRKIRDSAYLMEKYPGLFRYNVKKGAHPKAELIIRFNSPKQVEAWRQTMHERHKQTEDKKELDVAR